MHPRAGLKLAKDVVAKDNLELRSPHVHLENPGITGVHHHTSLQGAMDPTRFPVCQVSTPQARSMLFLTLFQPNRSYILSICQARLH